MKGGLPGDGSQLTPRAISGNGFDGIGGAAIPWHAAGAGHCRPKGAGKKGMGRGEF